MQQILKKVIRTTSMTMCLSVAVAMVPTVTQAHDGVVININASPSANGKAPVPVVINKSANAGSSCNICELQAVTGPCKANIPLYYYNVDARACKKFTYGGCEGNQNRFPTSKDCEAKCANLKAGGCTTEYNPVCGYDGKTYGNACEANRAGVKIGYCGECANLKADVVCTTEYNPVCGYDGKTYGNACEANRAGVKIGYCGECR